MPILCYSYSAFLYIWYIDQQMHLIKYNKIKIKKTIHDKNQPYMFWHQSAIFRESRNTKDRKSNAALHVLSVLSSLKY
jgi:hypothetical protein